MRFVYCDNLQGSVNRKERKESLTEVNNITIIEKKVYLLQNTKLIVSSVTDNHRNQMSNTN